MEGLTIGAIIASIIGGIILIWIVWIKDYWLFKNRGQASIDLATAVFEYLDTDVKDKTILSISMSKKLGDELVSLYTSGKPYDQQLENELVKLLEEIISGLKPFISKLNAAKAELDALRAAVIAFDDSVKWRLRIVNHLCSPPNPHKMEAWHVREQLLEVNCAPSDLLNAARGEASMFLRGYGINWLKRWKYKRLITKRLKAEMKEKLAKEYRSVLQQSAFANRK
ncbi:hypothetical protein GCM10017044_08580 [Kordiimonas sediminis]|uniref:Uncharacterized protein n=1 Tax=Kordiimonas sediminis TaxID=1735581 RepID=A0A919AM73_9PROT|nr:hypothetical protein [Kordiimonas sediminis]GHF16560.1 hypothetical protein GCM10017044_08580 [Kordiimonas sediminis]